MKPGSRCRPGTRANLDLVPKSLWSLRGDARDAAARLFSALAALEGIAVRAAYRGAGVERQLEDELEHQETFESIAAGLCEWSVYTDAPALPDPVPSIDRLVDFLDGLEGEVSLAILNVVAEAWLAAVFREIASWPNLAPAMFAKIGDEEARHSSEALAAARPDPAVSAPLVRRLEALLADVVADPAFMFPLTYLGGLRGAAAIGRGATQAHRAACAHLGLEAGHQSRALGLCARDPVLTVPVSRLDPTPWEVSAERLEIDTIWALVDVPYPWSAREAEARVTRALAAALYEEPRLNRVRHPGRAELYEVDVPVISVRRLYDRHGSVMTIPVRIPHILPLDRLQERLDASARRARTLPYPTPPDLRDDPLLARLAPVPRAAATVTNTAVYTGIGRGCASLVEAEGATIAVALCEIRDLPRRGLFGWPRWTPHLSLGIRVDHRAHNGAELARIAELIRKHLKE